MIPIPERSPIVAKTEVGKGEPGKGLVLLSAIIGGEWLRWLRVLVASTPLTGTGAPNGLVSAPVGTIYTRVDGGAGTTLYVKETGGTGNTGWVAK